MATQKPCCAHCNIAFGTHEPRLTRGSKAVHVDCDHQYRYSLRTRIRALLLEAELKDAIHQLNPVVHHFSRD